MLCTGFRCLLFFMISIQNSLSIPFDYNDFSETDLNTDYSSFFQDGSTGANSNLLAMSPNDVDPGTTSETNLLDYGLFDSENWLSSSTQADDNSMGTFGDMTIADSGAMCPLGKREDGKSCTVEQVPIQQPLPNLDIGGLSNIFGITDSNGKANSGADANAATGSQTFNDPCVTQPPPYLIHTCCDGPEGTPNGDVYFLIESCSMGTCTHGIIWLLGASHGLLTYSCPGRHLFSRPYYSYLPVANFSLL